MLVGPCAAAKVPFSAFFGRRRKRNCVGGWTHCCLINGRLLSVSSISNSEFIITIKGSMVEHTVSVESAHSMNQSESQLAC